jgi:hypothetical protein
VKTDSTPAAMMSNNPHGAEILRLVHEKQQLLRDAWLNFCGFKRPGVKAGLPVPEAEAKAVDLDKQIRELAKNSHATNSASLFRGTKTNWQDLKPYGILADAAIK